MTSPRGGSIRRLIVLGSTGSIGVNTLAVVEHLARINRLRFEVVGLASGANVAVLAQQAKQFGVRQVAVANLAQPDVLRGAAHVFSGANAALDLINAVAQPGDLVVGAMVGSAGIPAILAAIERGCDIALANKETLVAAGAIVMPKVREHGVNLLPIDSEHSAIFQCLLAGRSIDEVKRLVITASGGPFRTWTKDRMLAATVEEALNHPTWNMGPKVTIDSASLMNKGLEIIEAHWLFGLPDEKIEVIIHPQSIVHSFVEFVDGSIIAQLGPPDMRTPIQYALTWPDRVEGCSRAMDWTSLRQMEFEPVDHERFAAPRLAHQVIRAGGTAGAIFNAANEAAVAAFLDRKIGFWRIPELTREAMDVIDVSCVHTMQDVLKADRMAREYVQSRVRGTPEAVMGEAVETSARIGR
jgi:1-deoxy-D-xylulose-5-phosphate reductoisomerase